MKKRKYKKKNIILIVILLVLIGAGISTFILMSIKKKEIIFNEENNYQDEFMNFNIENIELEFLDYIDENYAGNLKLMVEDINKNGYSDNIWHKYTGYSLNTLEDKFNNIENNEITDGSTITFIGDVSLADNYYVMRAYNERNKGLEGILSTEMISYLNDSSFLIANSEFAFGTTGSPMVGKWYTFQGKPENVSIYHDMGVDLALLANNHIYDYGSTSFKETIETFNNANIPTIGAGANLKEASDAYYIILNGYKISFINANRSEKTILTPGATETSEGVFRCYDPTNLINKIKEEKLTSDLVIPILHWGAEGEHYIEDVLLETGKMYIDAGADAIVGHHAHVLQGIEFYNGKPIVYNIGNFIFDNYSRELGVVTFEVNDDMSMNYLFKPAIQENIHTSFLEGEEKTTWLNNMRDWSINTSFDKDGYFTSVN